MEEKNQPPIANFWKTFGAKDHLTSMKAIFKIWEDPFILYIGRSYDGHKILETFLELKLNAIVSCPQPMNIIPDSGGYVKFTHPPARLP